MTSNIFAAQNMPMTQELGDTSDNLATELRVEIVRAGIKQYLVAERAGLRENQLSQYLTGRRPLTEAIAEQIRRAIAELVAA